MHKELQNAILSTILHNGSFDFENSEFLNADCFEHQTDKEIFNAMVSLENDNKEINDINLNMKLNNVYQNEILQISITNPIVVLKDHIDYLESRNKVLILKKNALDLLSQINSDVDDKQVLDFASKVFSQETSNSNNTLFNVYNYNPEKVEETEFIGKEFLPFPKSCVSMISASGGTGKSWLAAQVAIREANKNNKVFLWLSEDKLGTSMKRIQKIIDMCEIKDDNRIRNNLKLTADMPFHFYENGKVSYKFHEFKKYLKEYDIIILDPFIAFFGGDENHSSETRVFFQLLMSWAEKEDKTIILLHHSSKKKEDSRGSSAITDAVRCLYILKKIKDEDRKSVINDQWIKIILDKDNYDVQSILKSAIFFRKIFPNNKNKEKIDITNMIFGSTTQIDA